jgi:hypothetical protein
MALPRTLRLLAAGALVASAGLAVIASPASAVEVSSDAELRAAFADTTETSVVLTADIDLINCGAGQVTRPAGSVPLLLSGAFTITQTCAGARVIGSDPAATGTLTINNVTITGGTLTDAVSATGGGIFWFGDVTLNLATVTGNTATAPFGGLGGGLFVQGTATINQSTISNNGALSDGDFGGLGGGFVAGNATVTDSTIANNTAGGGAEFGGTGGALFGNGSYAFLRSTISGNQALHSTDGTSSGNGGGVTVNGPLDVINSTVTSNVATGAASNNGGLASGGDLTLAYSTVVGNSAVTNSNLQALSNDPDFGIDVVFATVISDPLGGGTNCGPGSDAGVSQGYNYSTDDSCNLAATGDVQSGADPLLGPLAANGGPTLTRLPSATSPLLDRIPVASCQDGSSAGITTDQRGVVRPQGVGCDVGAVEVVFVPATAPGAPLAPDAVLLTPRFTG